MCRESGDDFAELSDKDLLIALGLVPRSDPVSLGALLLFGTERAVERWLPNAEVLFHDSRERHDTVTVRMSGSLLSSAARLNELLEQRASVSELYVGLHRVDVPLISSITRRNKGVNEMFESQLRAGRDAPDYTRTTSSTVTVAVPLGNVDRDLVRFLVAFENDQQAALGLDELRIVHEVRASGSATPAELVEVLRIPLPAVRTTASRLVEKGLLESRGAGRNR